MGNKFTYKNRLTAKVDEAISKIEENALAVFKNSIQDVIIEANKTEEEGGSMRVDTGFLRHSGIGEINTKPTGPREGRKRNPGEIGVLPEYSDDKIQGIIQGLLPRLKLTDTFYFTWTARYAVYREFYDGFVAKAIQKWHEIVQNNARRLKE